MLLPGEEYGFEMGFQREAMTTVCSFLVPGLFLGYPHVWHFVMAPLPQPPPSLTSTLLSP